jgi:propionate CoA-transferase
MQAAKHPVAVSLRASDTGKVVSARQAVQLIKDGDTVATGGFVGIGFAENIAIALEELFLEGEAADMHGLGSPRNLTLVYAAGQGDGKERGLNHLGHDGLVSRVLGGHWGLVPKLQQLAVANRIEAYNLPQGVITHLFRDIAAGKPGTITRVGLGTFVDPRFGGGKLNEKTTADVVRLMEIDGEEYLFYKALPINVGIIRGTTADPDGNVTMEREALTLEAQAIAMAARNSGGTVIVQVERIAERGTLNPRQVKIPGILVDCVVVAEKPEYHQQTFAEPYSAAFAGEIKVPMSAIPPMAMSERKIIARRAALELRANAVVNLGIGMPEGVANVAAEEQIIDLMTLTAEPGVVGGVPAGGLSFGRRPTPRRSSISPASSISTMAAASTSPSSGWRRQTARAISTSPSSARAWRAPAASSTSRRMPRRSCSSAPSPPATWMLRSTDGKLLILEDGKAKKFVEEVEHRTFSGPQAAKWGKTVLYVTERCVFRLCAEGLELVEIAPGVDLQKDILDKMDFMPIMHSPPTLMDGRIFQDEPMKIRAQMLEIPMADRLAYDVAKNLFFLNFEGLSVRSQEDITRIEQAVAECLKPIGHKVYAIVNYDRFSILPELIEDYIAMVKGVVERHYHGVTRYTSNTFLRVKLGEALEKGSVAPHLYETASEAEASLPVPDAAG